MRGARRLAPWLVAVGIFALVLARIPFDAFRAAIGRGDHVALAAVNLVLTPAVLCTDSLATWLGLVAVRMTRPLAKVFVARGATFLLVLINYAVWQGGFGYYLHRTGATPLRAAGATLFLMGTNLAALLVATTLVWLASSVVLPASSMAYTLVGGCGALALYGLVIALRPGLLARRELFAPLFSAGLRGHALAMAARVPHVFVMVVGIWVAARAWGIAVPFGVGLAVIPVIVVAAALPISPAGLGTTQAAMVYFFQAYAVGATEGERSANVLAFSIAHFVYSTVTALLLGLGCAVLGRRLGSELVAPPAPESPA